MFVFLGGEKPKHPEKNRSTRKKTEAPGEKRKHPEKNRSTRRKTLGARRKPLQTQPTYRTGPESNPCPIGARRGLTNPPSLWRKIEKRETN